MNCFFQRYYLTTHSQKKKHENEVNMKKNTKLTNIYLSLFSENRGVRCPV